MTEKIYLGKVKNTFDGNVANEMLWLEKHSWDCDWYWGFGYIGNKHLHTHFDLTFLSDSQHYIASEIFEQNDTAINITDKAWWIIRDLFVQAYALSKAAAVYRYGGHQTSEEITTIIQDKKMSRILNNDLEIVLNTLWNFLSEIRTPKEVNQ